jgi:hypothetical protein
MDTLIPPPGRAVNGHRYRDSTPVTVDDGRSPRASSPSAGSKSTWLLQLAEKQDVSPTALITGLIRTNWKVAGQGINTRASETEIA